MALYVARDIYGQLGLFSSKPIRYEGFWTSENTEFMKLPNEFFPKLTWDDEPKRVSLMLRDLKKTELELMDDKIKELQSLDYEGWDGYNAMPVDKKSIENLKALFRIIVNWDFKLWQIAPGVNGDICLNYKLDYPQAGIIIGPNTFTYFIATDSTYFGESDNLEGDTKEFNSEEVIKIMNNIHNINQNTK